MIHSTTLRLIDQIESGYEQHRADTDLLRAELQAKSEAAHPTRMAARLDQTLDEYAATVKANRERIESLRASLDDSPLADVIDLGAKRGERDA